MKKIVSANKSKWGFIDLIIVWTLGLTVCFGAAFSVYSAYTWHAEQKFRSGSAENRGD